MNQPNIDPRFQKHWEALQNKAKELGMNTQALAEPTPGHDWMDLAAAGNEKEAIAIFLTVQSNMKMMVKWAIQRLLNGEYGNCIHCWEEIPQRRLTAIPWTPLCLECQEKAEAGQLHGFEYAVPPKRLNAMQ